MTDIEYDELLAELLAENERLKAELLAENERLKAELERFNAKHAASAVMSAFGMAQKPTEMAMALYGRNRPLNGNQLREAVYGPDATQWPSMKSVHVYIHKLRESLGQDAIDSERTGYVLTAQGRAKITGALMC